ncbi:MFS transporter [Achromobacter xylosoxidans]
MGLAVRRLGPAPALLAGLCTGLAGTLCAAWAPGFEALLAGRFVQALGLATCSITTQTMLRDRLQGEALTRCFIMLGAVLSWSPALGPLAGQLLADQAGFRGVLGGIAALAGLLLAAADGRRSAKRGRPRQRASPCSGWRAACCATPSCCARPCWWPA